MRPTRYIIKLLLTLASFGLIVGANYQDDHLVSVQAHLESPPPPQSNNYNHHHYALPAPNGFSLAVPLANRAPIIMPANNQLQVENFRATQLNQHQTTQAAQNLQTHSLSRYENEARLASQLAPTSSVNEDSLHARIGLALRQASGDGDDFFQPISVISPPPEEGHHRNLDHQAPSTSKEHLQSQHEQFKPQSPSSSSWQALNDFPAQQMLSSTMESVAPTTTTTTTDHPNNIDFAAFQETQSSSPSIFTTVNSDNQQQFEQPIVTLNSNQNSTIDINNQVIYEGPATAPPSGDNYYFSSSERLPNADYGKPSNGWWRIGVGSEFDRASNLSSYDYLDYCSKSELLVGNKQRSLCKTHPRIMAIVARGLKLAVDECQSRFSKSRWNCSLAIQEHSSPAAATATQGANLQAFGDFMRQPIREKAFLNAIIGAAIAHAMTKACSQGELPEECSCDKRIKSRNQKNKIEWVACSDDIDYGAKFSRDFTDNTEFDSDTNAMINAHNYEVGRRVFKSSTDITCSCQNGENGTLCQTKKCWKHLGAFTDIGDELIRRYDSATHVQLSSRDPHKLRPVRRGVRKPKRKDLIFTDESPDYCTQDTRIGVLGTKNRHCNSTSTGPDSCSLLCCGRGYQVVVEEIEEDCNCKFVWCCQVKCRRCKRQISNDVCN